MSEIDEVELWKQQANFWFEKGDQRTAAAYMVMVQNATADPLPCPFCGDLPMVQNRGWKANTFIRCLTCAIQFSLESGMKSHGETVAAWNRRASKPKINQTKEG